MRVRDVMTDGAIGVPVTTTLAEAIETMLRARVSARLVFDADRALVGVPSEGDLLRRAEFGTDKKRPRWVELPMSGGRLAESYAHTHGRRVGEIMTSKVVAVSEDADIGEAVDLMLDRHVKRLPVLRGAAVVGVVSRSDLMKGLFASLPKPTPAIPMPRSRPPFRPSSTSSAGRRGRACGSRSQTASSPSGGRSPTNAFAPASG